MYRDAMDLSESHLQHPATKDLTTGPWHAKYSADITLPILAKEGTGDTAEDDKMEPAPIKVLLPAIGERRA